MDVWTKESQKLLPNLHHLINSMFKGILKSPESENIENFGDLHYPKYGYEKVSFIGMCIQR